MKRRQTAQQVYKELSYKMKEAANIPAKDGRCPWVNTKKEHLVRYHDREWGTPTHDSIKIFEQLNIEGAAAGIAIETILMKRENYRKAFANFDPYEIAKFDDEYLTELMNNTGILRNKLKIKAVHTNALAFIRIEKEKPFSEYIWDFTHGKVIVYSWNTVENLDLAQETAIRMFKQLKKDGFMFVGRSTCFTFMHAIGMINGHHPSCFRYKQLTENDDEES